VSVVLAIPVDRDRSRHVEIRESRPWELLILVLLLLVAAAATYASSRYGQWSFVRPVQRLLRDGAIALVGMVVVVSLYGMSLLFR